MSTANLNADDDAIVAATRRWLERAVIGLNLCPFAKAVYTKEQVRYVVSPARTPEELLETLMDELQLLSDTDPAKVDTTLLIHPFVLQDFLEREHHIDTRVQTAITMGQVAEAYIPRRAIRHLEKGRVVIFGAGVGMPYFSTDTAGAQRALEIGAEALLLAKSVDGVYTADPKIDSDAKMYDEITHREALERSLKVMDSTALSLCMDNHMPIVVFNMNTEGNIDRIISGERVGTLVKT